MIHKAIARDLLAVLCGLQGLLILAVNLNWNHAWNSKWPGHARFHVVWQALGFAALALLEIVLLYADGALAEQRFYLVALLAAIPVLAFFLAMLGRGLYGGLMADTHGVPAASFRIFRANYFIEINVAAEIAAAVALILIVLLYRNS